jgi:preprotein translocase subunit SecG
MEQVLLVVQVIIALALIIMVLIQRSDSDGFGLGGGAGGNGLLSGRSQANLMTRTTAILAAMFIINSLALSVIAAHGRSSSIVETIEQQQSSKDGAPAVPVAGEKKTEKKIIKDVKDERKTDETSAPSVPAADADAKPVVKVKAAKKAVEPAVPTEGDTSDNNN